MSTLINSQFSQLPSVQWGEADPVKRGPLVCMDPHIKKPHNTLGNYGGQYVHYRSLAHAANRIPEYMPDYTNFVSFLRPPQNDSWSGPNAICTFDPFGHLVSETFPELIAEGFNLRPTISITHTTLIIPEVQNAVSKGQLKVDGNILIDKEFKAGQGEITVSERINAVKIAIEPVWHLPGVARYIGAPEQDLRRALYVGLGGGPAGIMENSYNEYLPPFGETTVYILGDFTKLGQPGVIHAARTHDKCGSSDTHGATICSCRPALTWAYEEGVRVAQNGGISMVVYTEAEGRGHGIATKNGVYNARLAGPDDPEGYFRATEKVAGLADLRQQDFAADVYRWLGVKQVDVWLSGSPDKTAAMVKAGIHIVGERPLPPDHIPEGVADTEWEAKRLHGGYNYAPRAIRCEQI